MVQLFLIFLSILSLSSGVPLEKRDVSGLEQIIAVSNQEQGWAETQGWKSESQGWKSEPHHQTHTVEKHVPVYKPIYIEKKVHVPHEVVVEKRIPLIIERLVSAQSLQGQVPILRPNPSFNLTITSGDPNAQQGQFDPINQDISAAAVNTLIELLRRALANNNNQQIPQILPITPIQPIQPIDLNSPIPFIPAPFIRDNQLFGRGPRFPNIF